MKRMNFAVFFVVLFLGCADSAVLAQGTFTANSCSQSDVDAAINGPTHTAVDGDTINVPSGSCTWSSGIVVPSNIGVTIIGSGTPQSGSSTTGASSSCASRTNITLSGSFKAFSMSPMAGNSITRISCMVIGYSSGAAIAIDVLGTCTSSGCPNLRLDNLTFANWAGHTSAGISYGINAVGDMFGVVDHNTVNGSPGQYLHLIEQSNASYLGIGSWGDNAWAQSENYGSANFLFYENNLINYGGITEDEGSAGAYENEGGCRVVGRYNTFNTDGINASLLWHGTESSGRPRSCRAWEFYGNTINCPAGTECPSVVAVRGGTGLTWNNTEVFASGSGTNAYVGFNTYRAFANVGNWGACDGSTVYDTDDGVTYYSGTISSYSGGLITVTGTPGWSTNQWVSNGSPYSIHDVTQNNGSEITANTPTTVTMSTACGPGCWSPAAGDSIQILRATKCLDQAVGRGAGLLYSGTTASPLSPANEVSSPSYIWMWTGSSSGPAVVSDTARVIANRDYYNESVNQAAQTSPTAPFSGSSGMGHGTNANKPTSCTRGVGYWATDQDELYLCTAANTWTASYKPYTYPHPLTTGTTTNPPTPPPSAPTGLKATVQ
jgi:hypothetical protein